MIANGSDGGVESLLERSDGRYKYVQQEDERCLSSLVTVGRAVRSLQSVPSDRTAAYLDTLDALNDHYFQAREFEREVRGKFYRYDQTAERRFRSTIVEELSNCVEQLHDLLSAHDDLTDAITTSDSSRSNVDSNDRSDTPNGSTARNSKRSDHDERLTQLSRHTNYAVRGGWYPILEAYDHSLDPGEKIAEGKRRRRQRVYGQEDVPGIEQLISTPLFEQISEDDFATVRTLDRFAPADAREISARLRNRHPWLLENR